MERFLKAIESSVATKNWYAALTLSLTMPDICGWLEAPEQGSQARYVAWFERYVLHHYKSNFFGPDFTFLTGRDCYALRCSYLHEGGDRISHHRAREVLNRFMFSTTGSHCIRVNDVLVLDVAAFCGEMCKAVRAWVADIDRNGDVETRMKGLVFINTSGFRPTPGIYIS